MPFTVEDFEDLLRLLSERPEWQERLRRVIMPPELFRLPALIEELAEINRVERERLARLETEQQATRQELREGFAQTGERLGSVEGRLDRVEQRVGNVETEIATLRTETNERFDRVDERFNAVDERFNAVDERFNVVGERFDRLDRRFDFADVRAQQTNTDLGKMKGLGMEARYRERVHWFKPILTNPIVLTPSEISALVEPEVVAGRLSRPEGYRVERADLIVRGGDPDTPTYLAVEVSWLVDARDVRRANERARLLRKAGYHAQSVVAGQRIQEDARLLAERIGVGRVIEDELDGDDLPTEADTAQD